MDEIKKNRLHGLENNLNYSQIQELLYVTPEKKKLESNNLKDYMIGNKINFRSKKIRQQDKFKLMAQRELI